MFSRAFRKFSSLSHEHNHLYISLSLLKLVMEIGPIIQKQFLRIDAEAPVSQLIGKLKQNHEQAVLVFKKDKYIGVLEKRGLLRSKMNLREAKVRNYLKKVPLLGEYEDLISTAYLLYESNADFLPVQRRGELIGVVHALDIVAFATVLPEAKSFRVQDVRLVRSIKVTDSDPIATAIELMQKERIDRVPVFKAGSLYGIISYQDLLQKYLQWVPTKTSSARLQKEAGRTRGAQDDRLRWAGLPVSSFSTTENLVTIKSSLPLHEAAKQMEEKDIHSLIVAEGSEALGFLTLKNMLRAIASLNTPPLYNIKFIGLKSPGIDSYAQYALKKVSAFEAYKLQRMINNEFSVVLHIKAYGKEGKRKKYSIHLRVEYPGQQLTVSDDDWDAVAALHRVWANVKNHVKKKFRGDSSWKKSYE